MNLPVINVGAQDCPGDARDTRLNRDVAIKVLPARLPRTAIGSPDSSAKRQDRIVEFPVERSRGVEIGAPLTRISANALNNGGFDRSADGALFLVPVLATSADTKRLLVVQNWQPAR